MYKDHIRVGAIIYEKNRIKLEIQNGIYLLIGGKLKLYETPIQGLIRELEEELGVKYLAEELNFIASFTNSSITLHVFEAHQKELSNQKSQFVNVDLEKIRILNMYPEEKDILLKFFSVK